MSPNCGPAMALLWAPLSWDSSLRALPSMEPTFGLRSVALASRSANYGSAMALLWNPLKQERIRLPLPSTAPIFGWRTRLAIRSLGSNVRPGYQIEASDRPWPLPHPAIGLAFDGANI